MTIELQTGLPGSGKSLYTLDRIQKIHKKTGRPVFYSGIPINKEKLPDWEEIDPTQWFTAPPTAIVIIDEAQRVFRPRANGSAIPKYESELETHRHGGIDLVLITQGPRLISSGIRELVGRHYHAVRPFGFQRTTIHEWSECKLNTQARKDSIKKQYAYNKEVYSWYKSAEAHTVQASLPLKVWLLIALVLGLPVIAFILYQRLHKGTESQKQQGVQAFVSSAVPASSGPKYLNRAQYIAQFQPRLQGLEYTAPVYDDVTKPVRAPYPAACIRSKTRCQCYSQQGTHLDVPKDLCEGISAGGFFMAWDEREGQQVPRAMPAPITPEKTGGDIGGMVNLTPGHTAPGTQVASLEQQQNDGQNIQVIHNKR